MAKTKRPLYLEIIVRTLDSDLSAQASLLLVAMAVHSDNQTCVGWHGQAQLAKWAKCGERHVRRLLDEIEDRVSRGDSPVKVVRRPRFRADGRGRTSDEYQLVLIDDWRAARGTDLEMAATVLADAGGATAEETTGSVEPPDRRDQPALRDGLTGSTRRTNRLPRARDLHSDLHSDLERSPAAKSPRVKLAVVPPAPNAKPKSPKTKKPPREGHAEVVSHYFEVFEAMRHAKPLFGAAEGTAVNRLLDAVKGDVALAKAIVTNAMKSWQGNSLTIRTIASDPSKWLTPAPANAMRRAQPVQQGLASGIEWG